MFVSFYSPSGLGARRSIKQGRATEVKEEQKRKRGRGGWTHNIPSAPFVGSTAGLSSSDILCPGYSNAQRSIV